MPRVRALTLDLDDTLWAVGPTIERAEHALHAWLQRSAPATAAAFDVRALRAVRDRVARDLSHAAHDLSLIRLESVRRALTDSGDDPALAEPAFEVFFAARHEVLLFADVLPALEALSARLPIVAVTNGNADLARVGISRFFTGALSARSFGAGKPDPGIFHAACSLAGAAPEETLHVGDDWRLDVRAALDAGLRAAWMARPGLVAEPTGGVGSVPRVESMTALARLLEDTEEAFGR